VHPAIRKQISEILHEPEARREIQMHARMTNARRQNYILQDILEDVDILISSSYLQARVQIVKEISRLFGEPADREELRKNRDADMRLYRRRISEKLGFSDGHPPGSPNKPKSLTEQEAVAENRELAALKAMCEILKATRNEDRLTKSVVAKRIQRSRSTFDLWFPGDQFVRMKEIALIMQSGSQGFTKWKTTGEGFEEMVSRAKKVYEKNLS
jgi:ferritin-like protein